ncbi:MAG: hypothetical protein ACRDCZ_00920 [Culicoidibacterales bacterium]
MKYWKQLALILSCLGLAPVSVAAQGTQTVLPMNIQLIGDATQLAFSETTDPGFVYTDVFLPGDSIERTLIIKNQKSVPFRLSFELERVSEVSEYDLLEQINIEVFEGDTQLCGGILSENACDTKRFYAILNPGDERQLTMIATFNEQAGNEYKNKFAQYDWIFDAIVTSIPTTGNPVVPPAVVPPTTTRPPIIVPTTGLPTTGAYGLELFVVGIIANMIGMSYLLIEKRQKKATTH